MTEEERTPDRRRVRSSQQSSPSEFLSGILSDETIEDGHGRALPLHSHIPTSYALALSATVAREHPLVALEIGMAYGVSSLAILSGMDAAGGGRLISIDPHQTADWNGVGRLNVERAGFAEQHTLIEDFDWRALPTLVSDHLPLDFAYIDGWHTFDYVLLDFFYIDKMLKQGGIVAFNDCGFRAVHRALRFVTTHRRYTEIDVGLPPNYAGRNWLTHSARVVLRRSSSDRYFRKMEAWEPSWDYYRRF